MVDYEEAVYQTEGQGSEPIQCFEDLDDSPVSPVSLQRCLEMLLAEFMKQHAQENLAPKTVERYREMIGYLAPEELLAMNMTEITRLHLSREWTRLLKCGGHTPKKKTPRPMKPKTEHRWHSVLQHFCARSSAGSPPPILVPTATSP